MANTIYLPPAGKGIGAALGEGVSSGIMHGLQKQEREEKARRIGSMFQQLSDAPDRKTALEMAGIMITEGAEDVGDVSAVYAQVDRMHPIRDETPVAVEALGPDNKPSTRYVPRGQTPMLNTPEGVAQIFGPGYRVGAKPEEELEFLRPPAAGPEDAPEGPPQSLGKFPVSRRPEGSVTSAEYTMGRQLAADKRSIIAQDLASAKDSRAESYLRLAEERAARLEKQAGKDKGGVADRAAADDFRQDLAKIEGAVARGLGKQLADGTWSFEGENERRLFYQRAEHAAAELEKAHKSGGSKNYLAIAKSAVDKFPARADSPAAEAPAPAVKKKEPGLIEKASNFLSGKGKLPVVKSDADFAKLDPGAEFVDEKGKRWKKPKKKKGE